MSGLYGGRPLSAFILAANLEPIGAFDTGSVRVFRFPYPCASLWITRRAGAAGGTPDAYTVESVRVTGPCLVGRAG